MELHFQAKWLFARVLKNIRGDIMKDLTKYNNLISKCNKIKYVNNLKEEHLIYSYEDLQKLAKAKYDGKKLYLCVSDLQGANWCEGCCFSAKKWALNMILWCNEGDYLNVAHDIIMEDNEEELIEFISYFWDLKIVESNPIETRELQKKKIEIVYE